MTDQMQVYSSRTANAAAIAPTLYPTTLPAPVDCAGDAPVVVGLGATLGPPVCVGTDVFPPFVEMAVPVPVLAAPVPLAPLALTLAVISVVIDTVPFAFVSELLHSMLPSCTGFVAMSAGEVELKSADPSSVPSASLYAWQERESRDTPEERRSSRPQTDLSAVYTLVWVLCLMMRYGGANIRLTTSLSVSMVNSSNEMGWRQLVVLSVTVAAEAVEMNAARAAVAVKVFIVDMDRK